jgi:hypothetical protein
MVRLQIHQNGVSLFLQVGLSDQVETSSVYLLALRLADQGRYDDLLKFSRSGAV